jgi:long-chain acyl-CoA synthetase
MPSSLRDLLDLGMRVHPSRVALVAEGREVTWSELGVEARAVAAALVRDGIVAQARIAYVGKNSLEFFSVLFGCGLARAIMIPINWRLSPREVIDVIADAGADMVFVDDEFCALVDQVEDSLPGVRKIVCVGEHPRWPSLGAWSAEPGDPCREPLADDIAFQLYTSGTTGRPKGAMFANGTNLRVLLENIAVAWGLTEADVSLVCLPLFHMGGVAWALAALARGARIVVVRDFVPGQVLDTMRREQVTTALFVPVMLSALCAVPGADSRSLPIRRVVYAGAPINPVALGVAMKAFRCDFLQLYGLTEATGAFAQLPPEDHDLSRPETLRSAGRPYPWVQIRVVSPATLDDCAAGEVGEIWTQSAQNMVGYWRQPKETAHALTPDGWLRTGDLGFVDADGRIYLVDRLNDLIITGSENVYPAEVELVLGDHPAVAEVAVFGIPDERWGETVKALVVTHAGHLVTPQDLIDYARGTLARFKCPSTVHFVESLPRTPTGKVIKRQLREPYWRGHERRISLFPFCSRAAPWAVARGPSLDPGIRRLAVPVEDHAMSAGDFEGVRSGQSRSTGAVIVWDEGNAEVVRVEPGHLSFILHGRKLSGGFALTRTTEKRWILVKVRDEDARPGSDIVAEQPASVRSGKTWQELAGQSEGVRCCHIAAEHGARRYAPRSNFADARTPVKAMRLTRLSAGRPGLRWS